MNSRLYQHSNDDNNDDDWQPVRQKHPKLRQRHSTSQSTPATTTITNTATTNTNITSSSKEHSSSSKSQSHRDPFVIMLVGLPGSGKSTFAKALETAAPHKYVRINQDTLGNRKKCEALMRNALRNHKCPIIDRCNFNEQQRDYFYQIAMEETHFSYKQNNKSESDEQNQNKVKVKVQGVECIVFLCSAHVCIDRCEGRGDTHETIKPGNGKRVVLRMKKDLVLPDDKEREWKRLQFIKNYGTDNLKKLIQQYL